MEFEEFRNPLKEARQGRKNVKANITMDMNSMVDMAFLLLTFFMMTTTMVKPKVIELVMPLEDNPEIQNERQVIRESRALSVLPLPDNKLAVYQGMSDARPQLIPYGKDGIRSYLVGFLQKVDNPIILLKPHPNSSFENLIDLLDDIAITGHKRYTILDFDEADLQILLNHGIQVSL